MKIKNIFLLAACLTVMFAACGSNKSNPNPKPGPEPEPEEVKGDVKIYVTTTNRSNDFAAKAVDFSDKVNMSPATITLNPAVRNQTMDGFGAAVTGSTCYNLLKMTQADRTKFLTETFSPTQGMGYSYIRISIGCSDFSLSEYTCCDTPGIENFALQNEEKVYVIPILKEILAINPTLKIMGSPWTCPRWMKVNNLNDRQPYNSWTSGQLNPDYYGDYAQYFVKWIQDMNKNGIPIYSITLQNEPLNRGNSASLYMTWQEQLVLIRDHVGPALAEAGLGTKVYLFDHNYNYDGVSSQIDYPANIYADPQAEAYVAGAAYHNYGGNRSELLDIHTKYPGKELVFTETSIGTWNDGQNLSTRLMDDMAEVALGTVNNWCIGVIVWNLMLDSSRGPNRNGGCQTCYGAVDINKSDYKTITRNSHYYIIGHMSSVVKPGAVRIGTTGYTASGITYAAFENPDSSYGFVLLNNNNTSTKITISDGNHHFAYDIPAKSVVSYKWKK